MEWEMLERLVVLEGHAHQATTAPMEPKAMSLSHVLKERTNQLPLEARLETVCHALQDSTAKEQH